MGKRESAPLRARRSILDPSLGPKFKRRPCCWCNEISVPLSTRENGAQVAGADSRTGNKPERQRIQSQEIAPILLKQNQLALVVSNLVGPRTQSILAGSSLAGKLGRARGSGQSSPTTSRRRRRRRRVRLPNKAGSSFHYARITVKLVSLPSSGSSFGFRLRASRHTQGA